MKDVPDEILSILLFLVSWSLAISAMTSLFQLCIQAYDACKLKHRQESFRHKTSMHGNSFGT